MKKLLSNILASNSGSAVQVIAALKKAAEYQETYRIFSAALEAAEREHEKIINELQEQETETDNKILTDAYRFGFGSRDGVGFGGSGFSIVPYVSQDFVWTQLSEYSVISTDFYCSEYDSPELNDYLGTFRFGDKSTYGMKVELASMIQLSANYETSVVYRRHLFWYWSGSYIVSQVGYNILGYFTDDIIDSSPVLGSIFNFALKAGYLYGYYLLRQENMNWPFNMSGNEAPLTYETVNVGFTFLF